MYKKLKFYMNLDFYGIYWIYNESFFTYHFKSIRRKNDESDVRVGK